MRKFITENLIVEIKNGNLMLSGLQCSFDGKLEGEGAIAYICIGNDMAEILEIAAELMAIAEQTQSANGQANSLSCPYCGSSRM